ncbi:hypothetical protein INS49_003210 [Diaporthe citri]|uniref:uncharacterized protein n=1 Tax=Diaporthe citri TaxID=83186 RepID=UPI001C7F2C50|nr:uncharacterized protein INS49_003210 [Diaporthe citri]KAG6368991.1 hypothetical protein INS49_003210 [Diaporthe citri]
MPQNLMRVPFFTFPKPILATTVLITIPIENSSLFNYFFAAINPTFHLNPNLKINRHNTATVRRHHKFEPTAMASKTALIVGKCAKQGIGLELGKKLKARGYDGPFLTIKHFYPALKQSHQGRIINISSNMASMSSLTDNRRGTSLGYRLSKTALNQLTVTLGREFQSHQSNVTVNAIHPGWIPTAMSDWTGPDDMDTQTGLMIETIEAFGAEDTGKYVNAQGEDMPW